MCSKPDATPKNSFLYDRESASRNLSYLGVHISLPHVGKQRQQLHDGDTLRRQQHSHCQHLQKQAEGRFRQVEGRFRQGEGHFQRGEGHFLQQHIRQALQANQISR